MNLLTQLARPRKIRDVAGQDLTKQALLALAISPENSPRVLILHVTYGVGKTSLARAFARAVNCKNKVNGDACGICEVCQAKIEDTQYYEEYDYDKGVYKHKSGSFENYATWDEMEMFAECYSLLMIGDCTSKNCILTYFPKTLAAAQKHLEYIRSQSPEKRHIT